MAQPASDLLSRMSERSDGPVRLVPGEWPAGRLILQHPGEFRTVPNLATPSLSQDGP